MAQLDERVGLISAPGDEGRMTWDVEVSFAEKSARVTYDDSKTEVLALTAATADVGLPSGLQE